MLSHWLEFPGPFLVNQKPVGQSKIYANATLGARYQSGLLYRPGSSVSFTVVRHSKPITDRKQIAIIYLVFYSNHISLYDHFDETTIHHSRVRKIWVLLKQLGPVVAPVGPGLAPNEKHVVSRSPSTYLLEPVATVCWTVGQELLMCIVISEPTCFNTLPGGHAVHFLSVVGKISIIVPCVLFNTKEAFWTMGTSSGWFVRPAKSCWNMWFR